MVITTLAKRLEKDKKKKDEQKKSISLEELQKEAGEKFRKTPLGQAIAVKKDPRSLAGAPSPQPKPTPVSEAPVILRDSRGKATGVEVGGQVFTGLTERDVKSFIEGKSGEGGRALEFGEARQLQEQEATREEARGFLEEKGVFEETLPERTELDIPEPTAIEKIPVMGAGIGAITQVILDAFPNLDSKEVQTLIQNPETAREMALQTIQQKVIDEGITAGEKFGAVIESIPVVGSLVSKYASGLIEDPKGNVDTLLTEIQSERERASVLAEKAMTGKLGNPLIAVEQIEDIENNIFKLEQRIKLLSLESAQLRANGDQLNRIEEVILRTKERIFIAKQAAAGGTIAPATDSNIFLTLQELEGK